MLAGTGVQLSSNKARAEKTHYKCLSGEKWKMAFGGKKGELVAVIGCGMNRPDGAKQVSNVTWIRNKLRCFFWARLDKNEWLSRQLALRDSWHSKHLLSRTRVTLTTAGTTEYIRNTGINNCAMLGNDTFSFQFPVKLFKKCVSYKSTSTRILRKRHTSVLSGLSMRWREVCKCTEKA